ncbi:MAG: NAD-dependent epimerase/dehydratase family protein [Candidatus Nanoarchaeia archaeon]|nr:NAD-dependent epimerase/dehydratase family protein [Candidatus Nanoarchaeia archaeon]
MKTALVTGATGFIGRHLVKELLKQGYKIKVLARNLKSTEDIEVIKGDITNPNSLKGITTGVDYVFHLAALTNTPQGTRNPYALFRKINVQGTVNLLKECKDIKKFVYFSSVDALGIIQNEVLDERSIGNPTEPYEISKYESELEVKKFQEETGIPVTIMRPAMVYGEGEVADAMKINVAVLQMCKMVKKFMFPIIGSGKNKLPFTHVNNIVQASISAIKTKDAEGQTYMLADERSYSLNEVVKTIANIERVRFPSIRIPKIIAYPAAIFFEILNKIIGINPPLTRSGISYITSNRLFNIKKAKKELNYKPIDLKEGLKRTIEWYKFKGYL